MDIQTFKQKIINGQMSERELQYLAESYTHGPTPEKERSFLKDILKGFIDGYTAPNLWKTTMESILILVVIVSVVVLSYAGKIDTTVTSALLASVLGFLFGKIK